MNRKGARQGAEGRNGEEGRADARRQRSSVHARNQRSRRTVICLSVAVPLMSAFPPLLNRTYNNCYWVTLVLTTRPSHDLVMVMSKETPPCRHGLQMASQRGKRLALQQKLVQPLC